MQEKVLRKTFTSVLSGRKLAKTIFDRMGLSKVKGDIKIIVDPSITKINDSFLKGLAIYLEKKNINVRSITFSDEDVNNRYYNIINGGELK